jgi:hypothetical protein
VNVVDERFDPLKIVEVFTYPDVEYIGIGRYAAELHGSAVPRPAPSTSLRVPPRRTGTSDPRGVWEDRSAPGHSTSPIRALLPHPVGPGSARVRWIGPTNLRMPRSRQLLRL